MKKVSFVIPCYRSEHTLPHVVKEIREKMQELTQYEYDIFLVNDASPDNTMGTIILEIWCLYFLPICILGYQYFNNLK